MSKKLRSGFFALVAAIFALAVLIAPKTAWAADIDQVLYSDEASNINVRFVADDGLVEKNVTVNVYVDGALKVTEKLTGVRQADSRVYVDAEHYDVTADINNGGSAGWVAGEKYVNVNLGSGDDYELNIHIDKNGDIDQTLYKDEANGINVPDLVVGIVLFAAGAVGSYLLVRYQRKKDAEAAEKEEKTKLSQGQQAEGTEKNL